MNCVPFRSTSEPSVPPQQMMAFPLVMESLALLPDVPSSMAPVWTLWLAGTIVTTDEPEELLSACDTAVTVKVVVVVPPPLGVVGTPPGATYSPVVEMNPIDWLPPVVPFTCQVTAVFELPVTVAENCCVPKAGTFGAVGETTTVMLEGPGVSLMVTVAEPDFVGSFCETAMIVTC